MGTVKTNLVRLIALAALAGVAIALIAVVSASMSDGDGDGEQTTTRTEPAKKSRKPTESKYIVEIGDTLEGISVKTGVSVRRLLKLNEGLDPQAISPGQELKLR